MIDNMPDLNLVRLFVAMVESRNLSAAAQRCGMTRSNMSHRLKRLELDLGAQLFRRTTRHVELTQAGQLLYQHGIRLLDEMRAVQAAIDSLDGTVRGDVRIRLPTGLGHLYLAPVLLDFARAYPDIALRVHINDGIGDLISAEVDIALKITSSPPEDHVARRLCGIQWCLCASPDFLDRNGPVDRMEQLGRCDLIAPQSLGRRFDLRLRQAHGDPLILRVAPRLQSGDYPFLRDAVLAGLGVALLPRYAVWSQLRDGTLQEVLPAFEPEGVGDAIYLLTAPNRFPSMATRVLADFLRAHIERHAQDWGRAATAAA
ncbi:LysR family transcriptional regulator [Achromobacter sp. MFA1 R4]|uniref:LysR family transcriptional regulator n=1 Tax=Achromobacter sp. MFA1 R4 TaxID=1881016 RepID=UPI00095388E6|nr:LysR family transcriptional regulator [Achromobacter sp. MFA1 R4]SIT02439.1 transcriptional regulator, LysR family [Achromobacter sp. MFA1 R4]